MKSILHRDFKYVPAASTNIAKTFAKEKARIKALAEAQQIADEEATRKVAGTIRKVAK